MKRNKTFLYITVFSVSLLLASCGTSKSTISTSGTASSESSKAGEKNLEYLRKVYDNEVYAQNLSSKIKFTITAGAKDVSVSGSLKMKKDEVIRIQLTPLGIMEAGRIEFTKDYVLIMDRINKEYIKADYTQVDFLKENGLDFYALQALLWNSLYVPGTQKITDSSLKNFTVVSDDALKNNLVSLKKGKMDYVWETDKTSGQIKAVNVTYTDNSGSTEFGCTYDSFKSLGTKNFPTDITLNLHSDVIKGTNTLSMKIAISSMDTSDDWETYTDVSSKYKQVSVQDVMKKIMSL
ncbi:MAG: DUF4292 domain-containing protein [Bacteroidales bacterium]|nr:DUF4292 domain-containing protein [Bacteroidales bacterium]